MRKLKKNVFWSLSGVVLGVLSVVRWINPILADEQPVHVARVDSTWSGVCNDIAIPKTPASGFSSEVAPVPSFRHSDGSSRKHRIFSVPSFRKTFPDLQEVQIVAAQRWGVSPVANREEAEHRKDELVFVGSNPYFQMDAAMRRSIPYLVPRASQLLQRISRNFLDSLAIKQIPLHTLIVTSVLRTEEDVQKLRRHNTNASEQSCHRFGTTFDISYNRYHTVSHPDSLPRRAVRNDTLKWVLSEVLRDVREAGMCYVKYEVKQGCFHITVR